MVRFTADIRGIVRMAHALSNHAKIVKSTSSDSTTNRTVLLALAGLFLLNLLLRGFYLRYDFVNGDETVRALTALRWLDGARLYMEIVTDKPPGATFFYAAVFRLFGENMVAVHLAGILWNYATSVVIYSIGSRVCDRRIGLWAALLFIYFSTNYGTQDMMAANTELLMALPYTASFYLYISARSLWSRASPGGNRRTKLLLAGLLTGLAAVFKQVAVFNLIFFVLDEALELFVVRVREQSESSEWFRAAMNRLMVVAAGAAAIWLLLAGWLASNGAVAEAWRSVVDMGAVYVGALPGDVWVRFFVGRSGAYVLFNLALWLLAAVAVVESLRWMRQVRAFPGTDAEVGDGQLREGSCEMNLRVALWGTVSLMGALMGGRFFGHYFIQALPALSLLGAQGVAILIERRRDTRLRSRTHLVISGLVLFFTIGLVRFHHRTAILAYETLTGRGTAASEDWGMTKREAEARVVGQRVSEMTSDGDRIYIWGYALDVYWRSHRRSASRYLLPYYMTGRLQETSTVDVRHQEFWKEGRNRFIEDLKRERPQLILDVEANLVADSYPEIVEFIERNYDEDGRIGTEPGRPFIVYRLRE